MYLLGIICKVLEVYKAEDCPCITCIVKPMCENPCDAFNELSGDIDDDEYHPGEYT